MVPRFHQSTALTLLKCCPYKAWYYHDDLGGRKKPQAVAMARGVALDRMLFGVGPEIVVVDPMRHVGPKGGVPTGWTNDSIRGERDNALAAGKLPILLEEYEGYRSFASAVEDQLAAAGIRLADGDAQVEVEWIGPCEVACAGRLDWIHKKKPFILDLKTTTDASADATTRSIVQHGGHIQWAAYTEAVMQTLGLDRLPEMKFVFSEVGEPYLIHIRHLNGTMKSLGRYDWERACAKWKACLDRDEWPGYGESGIDATSWQMAKAVEEGGEPLEFKEGE